MVAIADILMRERVCGAINAELTNLVYIRERSELGGWFLRE